jgi:hypothetical protein
MSRGCKHHPEYPPTWGSVEPNIGADCGGLSGVYAARTTESSIGESNPIWLTTELYHVVFQPGEKLQVNSDVLSNATRVRLTINTSDARADFLVYDRVIGGLDLRHGRSTMTCGGHALICKGERFASDGLVIDAAKDTVILQKTINRALIIRAGYVRHWKTVPAASSPTMILPSSSG